MHHFLKINLSTLLVFASLTALSQTTQLDEIRSSLSVIKNQKQAEKFLQENPDLKGAVLTIDPKKDSSALAKSILSKKTSDVIQQDSPTGTVLLKIFKTEKVIAYRVQYIFFDGNKLSASKIKTLRGELIARLKNGASFDQLARENSMDGNAQNNGDLGWFEEGMTVPAFEQAVKVNPIGEIYTVDVPDSKWFYIVKNTHQPRIDKVSTGIFVEIRK